MKHLLKMADLSKEEIESILDLADQLKYEKKNHIPHPLLAGKDPGNDFPEILHQDEGVLRGGHVSAGGPNTRSSQIGRESRCRTRPGCCPGTWTGS